jgi:hypothetical protein
MKKEARKALREAIVAKLNDDMLPMVVGGHTISNKMVYAGGSQWTGCDRDWDTSENAWAWLVDGQYMLTYPGNMFGFDGHNMIERQTGYYRQPDRSETPPEEPIGEPLLRVPDDVLLAIGKGLADAIAAHEARQQAEDQDAIKLATKLA